jgi:hypothetical protein
MQFAVFVGDLLGPVVQRIGTRPLADDSNTIVELRPRVLAMLAQYAKDEAARAVVANTVRQYLAGKMPMSATVDVALRTLPAWSGADLLATYRERIAGESSPAVRRSLVRGLAAFEDPEVVKELLDYVLHGEVLRAGEISVVLAGLFAVDENNVMLVDWAMQHDDELRALLSDGELVNIPGQLMLCSAENIKAISDFYLAPERFVSGIEGEITEEAAEKRSCAAFRAREIESVREFLKAA